METQYEQNWTCWWICEWQNNANNNNSFRKLKLVPKAVSQRDEWNGACNAHESCENTLNVQRCIYSIMSHFAFGVRVCADRVCGMAHGLFDASNIFLSTLDGTISIYGVWIVLCMHTLNRKADRACVCVCALNELDVRWIAMWLKMRK